MKPKEIPPLNLALIPRDSYKLSHKMSYDEKTMKELESKTFDIVPRGKASKRGILKLSKRLTELILKNGHSI